MLPQHKNPSNPKRGLEGHGHDFDPVKTSFFLLAGLVLLFSFFWRISSLIIELSCHYQSGLSKYNYRKR